MRHTDVSIYVRGGIYPNNQLVSTICPGSGKTQAQQQCASSTTMTAVPSGRTEASLVMYNRNQQYLLSQEASKQLASSVVLEQPM